MNARVILTVAKDRSTRASTVALAALVLVAASANAQGVLSTAVQKAKNAKTASDAHTDAEQHPEAAAKQAAPKPAPTKGAATDAKAGAATSAPAPAKPDTLPPPTIYREQFAYSREARRDPFYSLLMTNDLRPTLSDLRLTGVLFDHSGRGNSLATLRDMTTNAQYRVGVGSVLGRMRVSAIRTETVVFTIDEFGTTRRDSLVLRDSTNKARGK
ncbi:MAG TPA: hypothetical protein VGM82_07970 [Gemmatimonadaceae bacterium]|jgi:type IV secretory pathway VirB10-like protein